MRNSASSVDYLHCSPLRALCSVCLPLVLVNVVLLLTSTLTNLLYSRYAGQTYFTVTGYLGVATSMFISVISSVYIAAWVKIAHQFALHDKHTITRAVQNALLAMLLACTGCTLLMVLFTQPILRAMSIPEQLHDRAQLYYLVYLIAYLPSALAAFFLTTVNGIGSAKRIFWVNILVLVTNLLAAALLLAVFRLSLVGAALCGALGAGMQLGFYWLLFRRDGYFRAPGRFRPDWQLVGTILRYSVPIAVQSLLCTVGYLLVTLQTNRLLSSDYITVLNVSLPLTSVMSAVGSAILAFCPQNYGAGRADRLRRFLRLSIVCSVVYGVLCFLVYASIGSWYYGRLFTDAQIVAFGREYWFWQGLGFIFLALVYPIRYFFDSVGQSRLSLLSGLGELIGNAVCAFWLIPRYGNIGRSIAYPLGWATACVLLLIAFMLSRSRIYRHCTEQYKTVSADTSTD